MDLRQKPEFHPRKTDLEIFNDLPQGDPWVDAKLPSLFMYLYANKKLAIPAEWQHTMDEWHKHMEKYAARQACMYAYPHI